MMNGQEIFKKTHHGREYICTVPSEDIAFEFCLKHRGKGYTYEEVIICESVSEVERWADHHEKCKRM